MTTALNASLEVAWALRTESGSVTCQREVIPPGRRVATAEAQLRGEAGRLSTHAATTCLIFDAS